VASGAVWAPVLVAALLAGIAIVVELRWSQRLTGLVVGMLPAAVLTAGLLTAYSLVLDRVR
jgi:hypothetical protein